MSAYAKCNAHKFRCAIENVVYYSIAENLETTFVEYYCVSWMSLFKFYS